METIVIKNSRHLRLLLLEIISLSIAILGCLCNMLSSRCDGALQTFLAGCIFMASLHVIVSIVRGRWMFPIKLTITKEYTDIDCLFIFCFPKRYHLSKGNMIVEQWVSPKGKTNCMTIRRKKCHRKIYFYSFPITQEKIDNILFALIRNGYEIDSKGKRC